jgi:hypothetical protein
MIQMNAQMKRLILFATLSLAACSETEQPAPEPTAPAAAPAPQAAARAPEPLSVECAIGDGVAFTRVCMVDQARDGEGVTLTIRNPQGGFRRLLVTPAGEVTAADGAEPAEAAPLPDGRLEVTIGSDRYRIPAPSRQ